MKKLLASLLALVMVLSLAACGGEKPVETKPQENDPSQTDPAPTQPADTEKNYGSKEFTQYGNAKITIVGAEFIKNDWDEDVLRIYYDYTNTGNSACNQYPGLALHFKSVTQDGEEVTKTSFGINDECAIAEDLNYDCPVQPGLTSRQTMLIKCDPNGGIVDISCYIMIGSWVYEEDKVECLTFQIDPKDLPGAPEPFEMAPIMDPTYVAGLPTSGANEDGEISIDGTELTKGDEGQNVLRVKLTVTNNGDDADMPVNITNGVEVYQDGLGLQWFSTWDLEATEADEAYEVDLEPGETVQCNALFLLRNDHPAEIVIEDLYSDLRLGTVCDVKAAMEAAKDAEQAEQDAEQAAKEEEAAAAAETLKRLVGVWDRTDSWPDHLTFDADGTGIHDMTGDEYPFSYFLEEGMLKLEYDDGDSAEYYVAVDENSLTLTDSFDNVQTFVRAGASEPTEPETAETEPTEEETEPTLSLAEELIGTWVSPTDGETYSFNADGTGYQIYEGVEYVFTYTLTDDILQVVYEVGDTDEVDIWIEGDTLTIAYNWTYTRQ